MAIWKNRITHSVGAFTLLLLSTSSLAATPFRLDTALDMPDGLSISGSERARYAKLNNQFRPQLGEDAEALSFRTLIHAIWTSGNIETGIELQDARAYLTDENSGLSTIVVNAAEVLQAYVAMSYRDAFSEGDALQITIGRQTFDLGSRRLIARNRYRDTIQAFNGIRSHWSDGADTNITTFFVLPVLARPSDTASLVNNDIQNDREDMNYLSWGIFWEQRNLFRAVNSELYVIGLDENDDSDVQTSDRQLYTAGHRLIRKSAPGTWDTDIENVFQTGTRRLTSDPADTTTVDVFAHFHHAELGYTFEDTWRSRLSGELDYATGNNSADHERYSRFDSLFGPRRTEFGPTGIYGILGRENIISTGLRYSAAPAQNVDFFISWRANYLEDTTDTFARSGVKDTTGGSGRFAGHQIEVRARYWLIPESVQLELGGAYFNQGRFLNTAPNASGNGDPLFLYTDLSFQF